MNTFKKISVIGIISTLMLTILPIANALTAPAIFSDIADSNFSEAILYLNQNGIVKGYKNNLFKPTKKIRRSEFTKILIASTKDDSEIVGSNCFSDVTDQWYARYICTAKKMGVINGYKDGSFNPDKYITFVEAAKIISKVMGNAVEDPKVWYKNYITELEEKMAIPISITSLKYEITRGEMSEMIWRILEHINNKNYLSYSVENGFKENIIAQDQTNSSELTTFTNDYFSLKYKSKLTALTEGTENKVTLSHDVTVEGDVSPICDFSGEAEVNHTLPDFLASVEFSNKNLEQTMHDNGDDYAYENNFAPGLNGFILEEGFVRSIDFENINSQKSVAVTSSAEGCGHVKYYFEISENQVLVVTMQLNNVFDYINMNPDEAMPTDLIDPVDAGIWFDEMVKSIQINIDNPMDGLTLYENDDFSFGYINEDITIHETPIDESVNLKHDITVLGNVADIYNMRDDEITDHILQDFGITVDYIRTDLQTVLAQDGLEDYYNAEDDSMTLEDYFITTASIGSTVVYPGYKVSTGAEGIGVDTYYFSNNHETTIKVSVPYRMVAEYKSMHPEEILNENLITDELYEEMINSIFKTFKLKE